MDALEPVRSLLPLWVGLAPLVLWGAAACVIGWSTAALARRVAIAPYRRLASGSSWVDRARHAQPARAVTRLAILLAAAALGALAWLRGAAPLSLLPPALLVVWVCACVYASGIRVVASLARELGLGARRARDVARDDLVSLLLLASPVVLALALAPALRAPFDSRDALALAALVVLFACLAWGGALRALHWLGLTLPVPERLRRACGAAAQGGPEPRLQVVRWSAATAFAFPLAGELAFTSRCLEVLDEDELRAIASHEVAHLREPLAVRMTRGAMLLALLPLAGVVAVIDGVGLAGAVGLLAAIVLIFWLFQGLARRMERRADHEALGGAESSPLYGRALERLYEVNLVPAVTAGRPVHPHLYDRLLAAGVTPGYARPEPPPTRPMNAATLWATLWLLISTLSLAALPIFLVPVAALHERASNLQIALQPGAQPLFTRALIELSHQRSERAVAFAQAAAALEPRWHEPLALAALELAHQGRCADARRALEESMERCLCAEDEGLLESARASLIECERGAQETTSAQLLPLAP